MWERGKSMRNFPLWVAAPPTEGFFMPIFLATWPFTLFLQSFKRRTAPLYCLSPLGRPFLSLELS